MRFHSRSYQTLVPTPDGHLFGELTLLHIFGDACKSTAAYIRNCETPDAVYHLVYDDPGVSLNSTPQLTPVSLIRLDGSLAPTGRHMVDIIPTHDGQDPSEHFVCSGRQTTPLTGYRDLEPGDILGTASAPLLRVPLKSLAPHDAHNYATLVTAPPLPSAFPSLTINATPTPWTNPPPNFSVNSTMTNANRSFASGIRYPITSGG